MKRLYKHIITLFLSLALLTVPAKYEFSAQAQGFPTIDVSNLLQNILSFLNELDDLDLAQQTFSDLQEKIEKYKGYVEMFQKGAMAFAAVQDIVDCSEYIFDEASYIADVTAYFYSLGARPSICLAAGVCLKDFNRLSSDLVSDFKKMMTLLKDHNSSSEINFLLELDAYVNEFRNKLAALSMEYRGELSRLYQSEMFYRQAMSNRDFRNVVVY